jgi:dolichol kinase
MTENRQITYRSEVLRKGIHLLSLSIPVIYSVISQATALWILVPLACLFVAIDILGHKEGWVRNTMLRYFEPVMRNHELKVDDVRLNGASHVLIAACASVWLFPKIIAITAFSILIISDICAALVGRRFGSHRFLDKSLEGTLAFAVSAIGVVLVIASISSAPISFVVIGAFASIVGALVENISPRLRLDDNISIPGSVGLTMLILTSLISSVPNSH